MIFVRDTTDEEDTGCPNDIGFGMGLRQSPPGTFTTESLKGTYLVAAFGDRFALDTRTSLHRSTAARVTFDGVGGAKIAFIENAGGIISADRFFSSFTYQVDSRVIGGGGGVGVLVDVVDIFDRPAAGPYASALIGEKGQSLAFFRDLDPGRNPNPTRLLGLGLFKHP